MEKNCTPSLILGVSNPFILQAMTKISTKIVCASRNRSSFLKPPQNALISTKVITAFDNLISWISSGYNPCLKKDRTLLKRLIDPDKCESSNSQHINEMCIQKNEIESTKTRKKALHRVLDHSFFWKSKPRPSNSISRMLSPDSDLNHSDQSLSSSVPSLSSQSVPDSCGMKQQNRDATIAINNVLIRKYFRELTQLFLQPFNEYFLVDLSSVAIPFCDTPATPSFSEQKFIDTFRPRGNFVYIARAKCVELYRRFINSVNFRPWCRKIEVGSRKEFQRRYLQQCLNCNYEFHFSKQSTQRLVEGYTNVKHHLNCQKSSLSATDLNDIECLLQRIKTAISHRLADWDSRRSS
ncbi:hypothetical protein IE077_001257 [Cardiosporidium cionae]|uniref:Uncharacterized protein n=1 Tax=Cardiosporidium cionae TaxID=476202 RepID=A0ABQ7JD96_9APIC|nr:hypothetical protein IE077_001257 [Cardiosporidium cionae]|eukprot:KAF8821992.1 hypothetical protein IE077_001257 [Cardiosporidium cionae]